MRTLFTKGFTLIETIIVIALTFLLLVVLYAFFLTTSALFLASRGDVASAGDAGAVVRTVEYSVQVASHTLASRVFAGVTYTAGPETLILEIPAIDAGGSVVAGAYDYVVYYLQGSILYERTEAHAASTRLSRTRQLSELVGALTFTYDNVNYALVEAVTIDLTTESVVKGEVFSTNLRKQIFRRN